MNSKFSGVMGLSNISKIKNPTTIYYGEHSLQRLPKTLLSLKSKNILIVTDKSIAQHQIFKQITPLLGSHSYILFDKITEDTDVSIVSEATRIAIEENVDTVIAIGGGAVIDTGKVVALKAKNKDEWDWGAYSIKEKDKLNMVAIITTLTSTFCNTPFAFIKDPGREKTRILTGEGLFPDVAFIDSQLALTLPYNKKVSAINTTLSTILEGYISTLSTPFSDSLLFGALEMIVEGMELFIHDETNIKGLEKIQMAGVIASYGINNAMLGIVAATANTLCGKYSVDFGDVSGVVMVEYLTLNIYARLEKFAKISKRLMPESEIMSKELLAKEGINKVRELLEVIKAPKTLSELGIIKEDLPELAEKIADDDGLLSCPVIPSSEEILEILNRLY